MRSRDTIRLSRHRRRRLNHLVRCSTAPVREVRRARILLLAWEKTPNETIAAMVGCAVTTVRRTRRDWRARGIKALVDRPRSGRPPVYGLDVRLLIVATATSNPPDTDSQWTHQGIAGHLAQTRGIGISASQVGRILADADLKPHKVRGWLNRPDDPEFFTRAQTICHLYQHIPAGTMLLSMDEKTGIQAKSRKHPTRRARPGHPARREFEYVRHGTVSLMAAMNVATGQVHPKIIERNNSETFIEFLTELDQIIPTNLNVHLVMDNGSSHTSKATRAWIAAHPRFQVTYTPKHASWLNMVEIFFSILTKRLLRRGEFTSRDHLATKIIKFITHYSRTAKPFRWRYDGRPLTA
ncbi:IS630 family transposase [Dactylosporangium sp. CA-233914]|uniref:IS630 family transposase n=1 Tax=Dactylosporangium sp. CA-233914 TaxID=3239934 RepID=UPI003D8CC6AB